jgi:hypothetical protein
LWPSGLNTIVYFLGPTKPLPTYGYASLHGVTVLFMSRERIGRFPNTAVVPGGRRLKDDRKQNAQNVSYPDC